MCLPVHGSDAEANAGVEVLVHLSAGLRRRCRIPNIAPAAPFVNRREDLSLAAGPPAAIFLRQKVKYT